MTGFEPATTRPPDVYSNRAELHPEFDGAKVILLFELAKDCRFLSVRKKCYLRIRKSIQIYIF